MKLIIMIGLAIFLLSIVFFILLGIIVAVLSLFMPKQKVDDGVRVFLPFLYKRTAVLEARRRWENPSVYKEFD